MLHILYAVAPEQEHIFMLWLDKCLCVFLSSVCAFWSWYVQNVSWSACQTMSEM